MFPHSARISQRVGGFVDNSQPLNRLSRQPRPIFVTLLISESSHGSLKARPSPAHVRGGAHPSVIDLRANPLGASILERHQSSRACHRWDAVDGGGLADPLLRRVGLPGQFETIKNRAPAGLSRDRFANGIRNRHREEPNEQRTRRQRDRHSR